MEKEIHRDNWQGTQEELIDYELLINSICQDNPSHPLHFSTTISLTTVEHEEEITTSVLDDIPPLRTQSQDNEQHPGISSPSIDNLLTIRTERSEDTLPPPPTPPDVPKITTEPENTWMGDQLQRCGWKSSITSANEESKILNEEGCLTTPPQEEGFMTTPPQTPDTTKESQEGLLDTPTQKGDNISSITSAGLGMHKKNLVGDRGKQTIHRPSLIRKSLYLCQRRTL